MSVPIASPRKILIVDDRPEDLRLLTQIVALEGFAVSSAQNAKMAIKILDSPSELPDIVLLDIKMPGINGLDLCDRIKRNPRTKGIPVIFISVADEIADKAQAFALGGVDYIVKPYHPDEVMLRIRNHLAIREQYLSLERSLGQSDAQQDAPTARSANGSQSTLPQLVDQIHGGPHDNSNSHTAEANGETFSSRELQLLALLNNGLGNLDIAKRLFLSEATVKWHLQNIFLKLGVNNRSKAIIEARKHRLV